MNMLFQIGIFMYVIVYAVVLERGFMFKEQITGGSVTVNALPPLNRASADEISYCCTDEEDSPTNCTGADALPCLYWDQLQTEYPPASNSEMSLTTRVNVTREIVSREGCNATHWDDDCSWIVDPDTPEIKGQYVANLEEFTIRIRHGTRGQKVGIQGASTGDKSISGKLRNMDTGETIRYWPDDTWYPFNASQGTDRSGDIMSIAELLFAVNLDLDEVHDKDGATARYDGITIIVNINYEMVGLSGNQLQYTYEPRMLSQLEYKIEESQVVGPGARDVLNRHAIRLIFTQNGQVGAFNLTNLLITLVTALGLLAVSATVTNFFMSYVLHLKDFYKFHRYEVTEDYDTLKQFDPDELKDKLGHAKNELETGQQKFIGLNSGKSMKKVKSSEGTPLLKGSTA